MTLGVHFAIDAEAADRLLTAADDDQVAALIEEIEEVAIGVDHCDTDKAWDAIHRSLTDGYLGYGNGTFPLNAVILGGAHVYEGDDYIVSLLTPEQVREEKLPAPQPTLTRPLSGQGTTASTSRITDRNSATRTSPTPGRTTATWSRSSSGRRKLDSTSSSRSPSRDVPDPWRTCRHRNPVTGVDLVFSPGSGRASSASACAVAVFSATVVPLALHTTAEDHIIDQPEITQNSSSEVPPEDLHPLPMDTGVARRVRNARWREAPSRS